MKKKKQLRKSHPYDLLPLDRAKVHYCSFAETLDEYFHEYYKGNVDFTYAPCYENAYFSCNPERFFILLRTVLDASPSEHVRIRLSQEKESASILIALADTGALPDRMLWDLSSLGGFEYYEDEDGLHIHLPLASDPVMHLFALDPVGLNSVIKRVHYLMDNMQTTVDK